MPRITIKDLIDNKKEIHQSGLESIIFELYKNALDFLNKSDPNWLKIWQEREIQTLQDIRALLKIKTEKNDSILTKDSFKIVGSRFRNNTEDIHSDDESHNASNKSLWFDRAVSFGGNERISLGSLNFSNLMDFESNSYDRLYTDNTAQTVLEDLKEKLIEYQDYKKEVAKILFAGYKYIVETMPNNEEIIDKLTSREHLNENGENDNDYRVISTIHVNSIDVALNIKNKRDFYFSELNLGFGPIDFPLDLRDLSKINTAELNLKYSRYVSGTGIYNEKTKTGIAEEFLGPLNIKSLQTQIEEAQITKLRFELKREGFSRSSSPTKSPRKLPMMFSTLTSASTSPRGSILDNVPPMPRSPSLSSLVGKKVASLLSSASTSPTATPNNLSRANSFSDSPNTSPTRTIRKRFSVTKGS